MSDFKDLKSKAVTASLWAIIEKFSLQIVQFVVSVILARILEPKDYGLIALTGIFTALSGAIIDGGFEKTLIRSKTLSALQVNSVFYVNLTMGCILTLLLMLGAGSIAHFFHTPQLAPVLRVVAIGLPISALTQVQRVLLMKELRYRKISIAQIVSSLASGITGVTMAYKGAGVWSLVGSMLVFQLVTLVAVWIRSDWYPGLKFSYASIKDMLPYGSRILISSVLFFLMLQFNTFIVGKLYSETDLGYFNRGGRLPDLLVSIIQSIVLKLAFPLFSKVRDEKAQLGELLRRTTQLVAFICFPLLALLFVNGSDITLVIFTAKWMPSVIFLELFCFITLLEPFVVIYREMILAKGHAQLMMRIFLATSAIEIALVLFLSRYGIMYVVVASIVSKTLQYQVYLLYASRLSEIPWRKMLGWIGPYLGAAAMMGLLVKGISLLLVHIHMPAIARLSIELVSGLLIYAVIARLLKLKELSFFNVLYQKVGKRFHPIEFRNFLFKGAGVAIRRFQLHRIFSLKDDNRPAFPYKLVYMCGKEGQRYLNASLTSVYLFWDSLPEVIVISDGTPLNNIVPWPRKLEVISWKEAADHFEAQGNSDLSRYAEKLVFGKKFSALMYLAAKYPVVYSDTDVLFYSTPDISSLPSGQTYIKMGSDVAGNYYSDSLLEHMDESRCLDKVPFNSGLMYLNGDFSTYPKWLKLCTFLADHNVAVGAQDYSEQTAFAILANHYNAANYWTHGEVLIKTDDTFALRYTLKHSPGIMARHYVNTRMPAFWRDFAYICINKKLSA